MLTDLLAWVSTLNQGTASFVGTLAGSSLGLVAILFGAMFNAFLNRKRDDNLRRHEAAAVARALKSEVQILRKSLADSAQLLTDDNTSDFLLRDYPSMVKVWPELLSKIGLLGEDVIPPLIEAYGIVNQSRQDCVLAGGVIQSTDDDEYVLRFDAGHRSFMSEFLEGRAKRLLAAEIALDSYLIRVG